MKKSHLLLIILLIIIGFIVFSRGSETRSNQTAFVGGGSTRYRSEEVIPGRTMCYVEKKTWFLGSWKLQTAFVLEDFPNSGITCSEEGYNIYQQIFDDL